jgi:choline dehydrogenase-like flavoprotein
MKAVDVRELPSGATISADLCIVGSGAAGMTVAGQFDGRAETVCVVESGGYGPDEETQALYDLDVVGHPVREKFMSRARYYGGTCNFWAGRCMTLSGLDLARRDWIPQSGWPIAYDELASFYEPAARLLRLPASRRVSRLGEASAQGPVERTLFASASLAPNVSVWSRKPFRFGAAYRRAFHRSPNVSTYLHASVTDIALNEAGNRVTHCTARSLGGKTFSIRARRFVLACGGIETARLLLASRSRQPEGIGNQSGAVGRYYMDHPRAVFGTLKLSRPHRLPLLLGLPLPDGMAQVGVQFSETFQRRERLLNSYLTFERYWSDHTAQLYQSFVHSMKIMLRKGYAGRRLPFSRADLAAVPELIYLLAPRELMPHPLYRLARLLRQRLSTGVRELIVVNYSEQMPNPQSRVVLGDRRDRFGVPLPVLDWRIRPEETASLHRLHELVDGCLRQAGLGQLDHPKEFEERIYTDASHHIGTARMSDHPADGVVDRHCAVHGVENLFVAGSAVFPTAGHANPTLTIVALALRLATHLKNTT